MLWSCIGGIIILIIGIGLLDAILYKPTPEEKAELERRRRQSLQRRRPPDESEEEEEWIAYVTALDMDEYYDD